MAAETSVKRGRKNRLNNLDLAGGHDCSVDAAEVQMSHQAETEEENDPSGNPLHEQHGSETAVQSPVLWRPDRSKVMVPGEINGSGLESGYRVCVRQNSNSSTLSCESFRSDRSKKDLDNFKERHPPDRSGFISSSEDEDDAVDESDLVGSCSPTIACE